MAAERFMGMIRLSSLAKGKTDTGVLESMSDDRPFWRNGTAGGDVSITRATARANIRRCIWPDMPASCRQTPMMLQPAYLAGRDPGPIQRRRAGCTPGVVLHHGYLEENARRKGPGQEGYPASRPSRSKSAAGSTRCSRSSGPSTVGARRTSGRPADASRPLVDDLHVIAGASRHALPWA